LEKIGIKTVREYQKLYNISDALLLADVIANFRDVCIKNYNLDPAWFYTAPGLAWEAMLKITKVELELLSDVDMMLMLKQGIRGGVAKASNRFSQANNKYMGDAYDCSKPPKYIQYVDANNIYGWAMSKPLPIGGFKCMKEEINNWRNVPCILEVELEYSEDLHDLHNGYHFAPENIIVGRVSKLVPNLRSKKKYVIHYEALKQCKSLGLKITKIQIGIKFKESAWLKEYIELNTDPRKNAKKDFEKDFFKLMNNSVFGKTMENIENRVDIRLIEDEIEAKNLAVKPNFDHCTIFGEKLVAIHMKRTTQYYNKPIYLGMCILDLSKTLTFDFHYTKYTYIKPKYGDKVKLLHIDTGRPPF